MNDYGISEKQWNRLMVHFEGEDESETISVLRKCTKCSKILTKGELHMNMLGTVKLKNWKCKTHGEVEPFFTRY